MRRRHVVVAVIGALADAFWLGGCGSAATPRPTVGGTASTGSPTASGVVNLLAYSDNDGPTSTVILTGAIGDYGNAVSVSASGAVDRKHRSDLKLALTRGSFRIHVVNLDKQLVAKFAHFPPNMATCSGNVTATGASPIVAGSGTGAYKGTSGSFDLTVTIAEVDAKAHCGPSSAFLKQAVVTAGLGTVTLH